ncbi:MAG: permease-like cell division protein FtsX [Steroidobacteraceae bacterium]
MIGWIMRHVQALLFALGRLARAPFATLFTLLVIALALTIPTALQLLVNNATRAAGDLAGAVDLSVYFKKETALDKVEQLARSVRERNGVATAEVVSADAALEEFRKYSGFGAALESLQDNPLPHVLHVRPSPAAANPSSMADLQRYLNAWPEVDSVRLDSEWVQRLNAFLLLLKRLVLGAGILLGIGVLAIVGNTIRLEILNRRAEIEVTKLVGGSNGFVRRPFLYTGLAYGIGGGLLALAILAGISAGLAAPVARLAASYGSSFTLAGPALRESCSLLGASAAIGLLAAWIATSRQLARIAPRA